MAKQPETVFKERLFKKIKALGLKNIYIKKLVAGSVRGIPDLLIIVNGTVLMPELKVRGKKPTALQNLNMAQINRAGGKSWVLYPYEEKLFLEYLEELSIK